MPITTPQFTPKELLDKRDSVGPYYPVARADLSIVFETYGEPGAVRSFPVLPKSLTIHRNSYKEADTWSLELESKYFPISPEAVRSGGVEIRVFQTDGVFQGILPPIPVLEQELFTGHPPSIMGLFDEYGVDMTDNGRIVRITGTDYTALFTGKIWPDKKRIATGQRLDRAIQGLLDEVAGAQQMRLVVETEEGLPIVGSIEGPTNKKRIPLHESENYWDAMYKLVVRYGYILFVRNLDLVIADPRYYIEGKTKARELAWGQNILSLNMSRKIGKQRTPTIEMRSYDAKGRRNISARYPETTAQANVKITGKKKKKIQEEIKVYHIHGTNSKDTLQRAAKARYNLLSRSEQEVQLTTRNLKDGAGVDLLDVTSGEAIFISFAPFTDDFLEAMPRGQIVSYLSQPPRNFPDEVAQDIADTIFKNNQWRRPFRVKEATIDYSVDNGVTLTLQLHNFVNVGDKDTNAR